MNTSTQGALGEAQAARYLEKKGYKLLARNFRTAGGELDLIALKGKTLVFVEVKQRSSDAFGGPIAAVTLQKQQRIARAAAQFLKVNARINYSQIRFDIISIIGEDISHLEGAFCPPRTTL